MPSTDHLDQLNTISKTHYPLFLKVAHGYLANHHDAEDAVQAALTLATERLDTYDPTFTLPTWISALVKMEARSIINYRQALKRTSPTTFYLSDFYPSIDQRPTDPSLVQALQASISTLPPRQQQIIRLHYFEGKSTREIAPQFSMSAMWVSKELSRAHRALRRSRLIQQCL